MKQYIADLRVERLAGPHGKLVHIVPLMVDRTLCGKEVSDYWRAAQPGDPRDKACDACEKKARELADAHTASRQKEIR